MSHPFGPYENLRVQLEDAIAIITIDRPEKRNAIDLATIRELYQVLEATAHDPFEIDAELDQLRLRRDHTGQPDFAGRDRPAAARFSEPAEEEARHLPQRV